MTQMIRVEESGTRRGSATFARGAQEGDTMSEFENDEMLNDEVETTVDADEEILEADDELLDETETDDVDAAEAAEKAAHIVGLLPANNLTGPAIFEFEQPTSVLSAGAAPEKAAAALIDKDSAVELYAGFGKHVYTAFATIGGNAVGVVATGETLCHNCVAKASRFVRLCDAFSVPVLTIVNTNGFAPSATDDIAGGIREAARLAATYADATTAKVALLSGKAVGPVYTALANADLKIAVNGCTVSALEPNAAVSVLYKEEIDASDNIISATNAKAAAYAAEVCSASSAVAAGAADMVCDAANARASVVAAFELLSTKRAARLPKKHGNMAL